MSIGVSDLWFANWLWHVVTCATREGIDIRALREAPREKSVLSIVRHGRQRELRGGVATASPSNDGANLAYRVRTFGDSVGD